MKSLSLIGMAKNAGKTTVLNALLKTFDPSILLGLTSIGRDGEDIDVVTGTHKPRIYIKSGAFFATTTGLMRQCDVTKEIVNATGMNTPLGEVIIIRAKSDGYIQLAGPSMNSQIKELLAIYRGLGIHLSIVDGAISRKSLADPSVTDSTILCTGASLSNKLSVVLEQTKHIHDLLCLPGIDERPSIEPNSPELVFDGAITDKTIDGIIKQGIKNIDLIAVNSSKLLFGPDSLRRMNYAKINIYVREKTNLIGITINPLSPSGNSFDGKELKFKLEEIVTVPVVDVMQGDDLNVFFI